VLVVAIFYFLRRRIDPAQVWAAITAMTGLELATLGLLAVWNLCTYAFVWMAVTPGLGFWRAMVMTQTTTAVANTVPGGSAIGIGMTYSKLGMPVLALALVALQGGATGQRVIAALLGIAGLVAAIVVFALMLRSEQAAHQFGLLAGRVASRLLGLVRRPPVAARGQGAAGLAGLLDQESAAFGGLKQPLVDFAVVEDCTCRATMRLLVLD
jgi:hypothetical protein